MLHGVAQVRVFHIIFFFFFSFLCLASYYHQVLLLFFFFLPFILFFSARCRCHRPSNACAENWKPPMFSSSFFFFSFSSSTVLDRGDVPVSLTKNYRVHATEDSLF